MHWVVLVCPPPGWPCLSPPCPVRSGSSFPFVPKEEVPGPASATLPPHGPQNGA